MLVTLCFALGHMIRDGWPALGTTHGARALGAFICALGTLAVFNPLGAALIWGCVLAGFYVDQKHGEGQRARGWSDAGFLFLSGVTSVAPLALGLFDPWFLLVGLVKPPIWFAVWCIRPDRWHPWLEPTRVSAMTFGAALGAAVSLVV